MAEWRGYANLLLDMTKYVGTSHKTPNGPISKTTRGTAGRSWIRRAMDGPRDGCSIKRCLLNMMGGLLGGFSRLGLDLRFPFML